MIPLYCYVTPAQEYMLERYIVPRAGEFALKVEHGPQKAIEEIYRDKARMLARATLMCSEFVYADLDVLFVRPVLYRLRDLMPFPTGIAFQSDTIGGVCTGFLYQRSDPKVADFWYAVSESKVGYEIGNTGDQFAANLLKHTINHTILPSDEFYTTCSATRGCAIPGWRPTDIPAEARIIHANCTTGKDKAAVMDRYIELLKGR